MERLRDDKLELMKQQIANGELQANWSYRGELLQYIGISANFFGGLGLTLTGNPVAVSAGTKMMAYFDTHIFSIGLRARPVSNPRMGSHPAVPPQMGIVKCQQEKRTRKKGPQKLRTQ